MQLPVEGEKNMTTQAPSSTLHLEGLIRYFRYRDSSKHKLKWILRLLNPTKSLWKDLMLYHLILILNSNQGLAIFRQKQILRSNRHKN